MIRDSAPVFRWQPLEGASRYHLRVSRREDLKTSYRPCFDLVVSEASLGNPRTGLFNPDTTYYWSVRVRNVEGVWSDWAPVQTFSWQGPCPPVELKAEQRGDDLWLTWQPNPRGTPPVSYEVYASDMRGFRPSKKPYQVYKLGEVPGNLVGTPTKTEFLMVSADAEKKAPNKSSYRVIAVDAHGTRGGTSWPLELDHPLIYSRPVITARVGVPYAYQVRTLRCNGDLQYRYQKPGYGWWEKEGYAFELAQGPKWLHIDLETGLLSGTPTVGDLGPVPVRVKVRRTWPNEVKKDQYRPKYFLKDAPKFQAEDVQSFELRVEK